MVSLSLGHWVGLIITLALFVALMVHAARSVASATGFSLSGRKAGATMVAGSIAGTSVAGSSTVGTAQMAYSYGLTAWWFTLGVGLGLVVMALFYARRLRASGAETLPQYLAAQYGRAAGLLASAISSTGILFSAVASALSGIAVTALLFGIGTIRSAAIIAALVVASVFFGGLKGAGLTGLLKMAAIGLALAVAGVLACLTLAHTAHFATIFPPKHWFNPLVRGIPETIADVAALIIGMICTQTYIQAIFSAADARTAARGTMIAAALSIPVGLPCVAVGMAMHLSHPHTPAIFALPLYLATELPPLLGGIGLAGILFSVVGSIAGLALGIGTMMAGDFGRGVFRLGNETSLLWINRTTVLAVTLIAVVIAVLNAGTQILDWNYLSMALRGAGVFLPMALAVFLPSRLGGGWAALSMAVSTALAVAGRFVFGWPLHPLFVGLTASAVLVAVGVGAGWQRGATKHTSSRAHRTI